ncbi:MAG: MbcA/ParS/Xre antitoxin family protein [Bacteroidota bacterium]
MSKTVSVTKESLSFSWLTDQAVGNIIATVREGVKFSLFQRIMKGSPFSLQEWSRFLHLSERSMQRYKAEKKRFDPIHSEKILEITFLYQRGLEVFGDSEKFNIWLNTESIALGGVSPKELMDTTFGINLLNDELTRIEHGVLA